MSAAAAALPATMTAAVVEAPGSVRVASARVPQPAPHEVLLRVEGCGVCGSNVPVWAGNAEVSFPLAPGEPGHEAWGVVEAVGGDVQGVEIGTRVAALSYRAFAQYDVAAADTVVPLPPELDGRPVPGEPLGCAVNVFERSGVGRGDSVAVVGIGFLGAVVVQLCRAAGADVVALSRRRFSLEVAEGAGARAAGSAEEAIAVNGRELFTHVIEAAGAQATLELATQLTGVRGRLVIAGYHQDGPRQVDMQLWNWRGLDVINAHERDPQAYVRGMHGAVAALVEGRIDPAPLYTHRFPLAQLGDALEAARARPEGFVKALVEP